MEFQASFAEVVYVLHAFEKRSRKTAKDDVELARLRYRTLVRQQQQRGLTGGSGGGKAEADRING